MVWCCPEKVVAGERSLFPLASCIFTHTPMHLACSKCLLQLQFHLTDAVTTGCYVHYGYFAQSVLVYTGLALWSNQVGHSVTPQTSAQVTVSVFLTLAIQDHNFGWWSLSSRDKTDPHTGVMVGVRSTNPRAVDSLAHTLTQRFSTIPTKLEPSLSLRMGQGSHDPHVENPWHNPKDMGSPHSDGGFGFLGATTS